MQVKKLLSTTQFILSIDWMTTKEFCAATGAKEPYFTGNIETSADQFLQIDCIKWRMVKDYAKFLNKNLTEEMFIGKRPVFPGFVKITQNEATKGDVKLSFDNFGKDEFSVTQLKKYKPTDDKLSFVTSYHLKTIEDLVKLDIDFIQYNDYYN